MYIYTWQIVKIQNLNKNITYTWHIVKNQNLETPEGHIPSS